MASRPWRAVATPAAPRSSGQNTKHEALRGPLTNADGATDFPNKEDVRQWEVSQKILESEGKQEEDKGQRSPKSPELLEASPSRVHVCGAREKGIRRRQWEVSQKILESEGKQEEDKGQRSPKSPELPEASPSRVHVCGAREKDIRRSLTETSMERCHRYLVCRLLLRSWLAVIKECQKREGQDMKLEDPTCKLRSLMSIEEAVTIVAFRAWHDIRRGAQDSRRLASLRQTQRRTLSGMMSRMERLSETHLLSDCLLKWALFSTARARNSAIEKERDLEDNMRTEMVNVLNLCMADSKERVIRTAEAYTYAANNSIYPHNIMVAWRLLVVCWKRARTSATLHFVLRNKFSKGGFLGPMFASWASATQRSLSSAEVRLWVGSALNRLESLQAFARLQSVVASWSRHVQQGTGQVLMEQCQDLTGKLMSASRALHLTQARTVLQANRDRKFYCCSALRTWRAFASQQKQLDKVASVCSMVHTHEKSLNLLRTALWAWVTALGYGQRSAEVAAAQGWLVHTREWGIAWRRRALHIEDLLLVMQLWSSFVRRCTYNKMKRSVQHRAIEATLNAHDRKRLAGMFQSWIEYVATPDEVRSPALRLGAVVSQWAHEAQHLVAEVSEVQHSMALRISKLGSILRQRQENEVALRIAVWTWSAAAGYGQQIAEVTAAHTLLIGVREWGINWRLKSALNWSVQVAVQHWQEVWSASRWRRSRRLACETILCRDSQPLVRHAFRAWVKLLSEAAEAAEVIQLSESRCVCILSLMKRLLDQRALADLHLRFRQWDFSTRQCKLKEDIGCAWHKQQKGRLLASPTGLLQAWRKAASAPRRLLLRMWRAEASRRDWRSCLIVRLALAVWVAAAANAARERTECRLLDATSFNWENRCAAFLGRFLLRSWLLEVVKGNGTQGCGFTEHVLYGEIEPHPQKLRRVRREVVTWSTQRVEFANQKAALLLWHLVVLLEKKHNAAVAWQFAVAGRVSDLQTGRQEMLAWFSDRMHDSLVLLVGRLAICAWAGATAVQAGARCAVREAHEREIRHGQAIGRWARRAQRSAEQLEALVPWVAARRPRSGTKASKELLLRTLQMWQRNALSKWQESRRMSAPAGPVVPRPMSAKLQMATRGVASSQPLRPFSSERRPSELREMSLRRSSR